MTHQEIQVGTIREFTRITTVKRSTSNIGDLYRTYVFWSRKDASAIAKPVSPGMLWTHKRKVVKAVWDGKHWREIGEIVKPK